MHFLGKIQIKKNQKNYFELVIKKQANIILKINL